MKADISRTSFEKTKHYQKVNVQQGRVQTDADWNEQVDIQVYHERTFLQDIIGRTGAPTENAGFEIKLDPSKLGYTIGAGHYYADGILCENDSDVQATEQIDLKPFYFSWDDIFSNVQASTTFRIFLKKIFKFNWIDSEGVLVESTDDGKTIRIHTASGTVTENSNSISITLNDEPSKATKTTLKDEKENKVVYEFVAKSISGKLRIGYTPALPTGQGLYLAYLHVWERHLTRLDDPEMREVALAGSDTTTRTKTVWQVRLLAVQADDDQQHNCQSQFGSWNELIAKSTGTMQARAEPTAPTKEPCELPPQAGYRRLQNQLYRVEIHDEGMAENGATFKWSRENGSIATKILDAVSNENKIIVGDTGRDTRLGFAPLQWVEVIDDRHELWGLSGTLVQLDDVQGNDTLIFNPNTIRGDAITNENFPQEFNPKVRRWDSDGAAKVQIPADNDGYIELEDGVQVKFAQGTYKTGDYWLIPARTVTANIEWPKIGTGNDPAPLRPEGIMRHFCRLALLEHVEGALTLVDDCRQFFTPASALTLNYVSGDGQEAQVGKVLPSELKALVTTGDEPVRGIRVQFQVLVGNGSLDPPEAADPKTCIATSDANGFVSCRWTLGDNPSAQQVKATLLDINGSPILLPLYFNTNLTELEATATTGIINLNFDSVVHTQDRVIFGTFEHFLKGLTSPPAVMLGLASDNELGNQETLVIFMEDYGQYRIVDTILHFKAVGIDLKTFNISFPANVVTELAKLKRKIGLRWWAVPAQPQKPQIGKPIEPPTIVFEPNVLSMNQPTRVIVTDVSANTRPDVVDVFNIKLSTTDSAAEAGIDIKVIETGPDTRIFVTQEIRVVDQNSVVVGDKIFKLIGAIPGLSLIATYTTTAADGRQIVVSAEAQIKKVDFPPPTIVFKPGTITLGQPTTVIVTDASANKDPNLVDKIAPNSLTLGSLEVQDVRPLDATETGPDTRIFVTQEIRVVDQNSVSIANGQPFRLPGALPNGALVVTYKDPSGNQVKATAKII
jgi:Family of unknown function (DUF6519)